jgi:hypothetical protein
MRLIPSLLGLALATLTACSGGPLLTEGAEAARDASALRAQVDQGGIRLSNATDRTIYYLVFEANFATLALWAPCTEPGRCRSVAPGKEVVIPLSEVTGYKPGATEGIVYWWHLEPRSGGPFALDTVRSVRVTF